ncbi:MAG: CDP-diacylglycerol--glycerol-3-phosphate 3-phosphatidyltransferase [Planctomycetota bacterium]
MKLPNQITLGRLVLTIVGLVVLALHPLVAPGAWWGTWVVFGLLFVASATDALDGYVARRTGQTSRVGRRLDPFVDKILICGTLILLLRLPSLAELLPAWFVVVVVAREFFVTTVRGMVEATGRSFAADNLGKWKMTAQCVFVAALVAYQGGWEWTRPVAVAFLWISLALTVLSGLNYQRKAWHALEL